MKKSLAFLDTNVIDRIIEQNEIVINKIYDDSYQKTYLISSMTLMELISHVENRTDNEISLCNIIKDYNIDLSVKESPLAYFLFKKNVDNFNVLGLKHLILDEFATTLAIYTRNFTSAMIAHLFYALNFENVELWKQEMEKLESYEEIEYLKELISDSYLGKTCEFKKIYDDYLKSKIIHFALLAGENITEIEITELSSINLFRRFIKEPNSYSECLDKIPVMPEGNITKLEYIFMQSIVVDSLKDFYNFKMNDLVDIQNFEFAYQNKCYYFTCDEKSIKKYKRYFKKYKEVMSFIDNYVVVIKS